MNSGSGFTTGSAFDAAGNLYVTNFSNSTVAKYDNNGVFLNDFGGGYSTPESILIDGAGNVFVGSLVWASVSANSMGRVIFLRRTRWATASTGST